jgi:hypothetical protein
LGIQFGDAPAKGDHFVMSMAKKRNCFGSIHLSFPRLCVRGWVVRVGGVGHNAKASISSMVCAILRLSFARWRSANSSAASIDTAATFVW